MSKAVIGVFDDPQRAARAREELIGAGFAEIRVMLHANDASDSASASAADARPLAERSGTDAGAGALGEIFSSLFDLDGSDQKTGRLAEAMRSGGFLLVVQAEGEDAARAAALMRDSGSIDVGETTV